MHVATRGGDAQTMGSQVVDVSAAHPVHVMAGTSQAGAVVAPDAAYPDHGVRTLLRVSIHAVAP